MRQMNITIEIEADKLAQIGRFIILYSTIEFMLQELLYKVVNVQPAVGRFVIRDFRASEYGNTICKMKEVMGIKNVPDMSEIMKAVGELSAERNKLAHGVWVVEPKTKATLLRVQQGTWEQISTKKAVSRKFKPEGINFSLNRLAALNQKAEFTLQEISKISSKFQSKVITKSQAN